MTTVATVNYALPLLLPYQLDMDRALTWFGLALAVPVAFGIALTILRSFLYVCRPNEILIFSGRRHTLPDGTVVGYKILRGGWGVRTPLLETVSRMDMRLLMVDVAVSNAYSKGGIPLSVQAIGNVKIGNSPVLLRNAVERFLGTDPHQIAVVARQTLEGVLREVLSQLTPEEVNQDRLKFAESLRNNAKDDFDKLGLELDILKVQHVADEQGYLQNLGRARIATMIRDAQNAENEANQKIAEEESAARQRAESAQKRAHSAGGAACAPAGERAVGRRGQERGGPGAVPGLSGLRLLVSCGGTDQATDGQQGPRGHEGEGPRDHGAQPGPENSDGDRGDEGRPDGLEGILQARRHPELPPPPVLIGCQRFSDVPSANPTSCQ